MAGSVNKVILVGNLGRDPESRSFQNGGKVVNLRIATSERWRAKSDGEMREKTEWHTVVIFSEPLCKVVEDYVKKGAKLATIVHTPGDPDGSVDVLAPQAGYILTRVSRRSGRAGDDIIKLIGETRSAKPKAGALED